MSEQPPIDGPDDPTDDATTDSTEDVVDAPDDSTEEVVEPGPVEPVTDRIELVDLNTEMQRSYIDYAMAVIVSRALPDVRDGLKPVHRRVIYGMYDGGYRPDRGYNKCSGSSATSWGSTTRTATGRSTTRWCVWCSRGHCAIR